MQLDGRHPHLGVSCQCAQRLSKPRPQNGTATTLPRRHGMAMRATMCGPELDAQPSKCSCRRCRFASVRSSRSAPPMAAFSTETYRMVHSIDHIVDDMLTCTRVLFTARGNGSDIKTVPSVSLASATRWSLWNAYVEQQSSRRAAMTHRVCGCQHYNTPTDEHQMMLAEQPFLIVPLSACQSAQRIRNGKEALCDVFPLCQHSCSECQTAALHLAAAAGTALYEGGGAGEPHAPTRSPLLCAPGAVTRGACLSCLGDGLNAHPNQA